MVGELAVRPLRNHTFHSRGRTPHPTLSPKGRGNARMLFEDGVAEAGEVGGAGGGEGLGGEDAGELGADGELGVGLLAAVGDGAEDADLALGVLRELDDELVAGLKRLRE